MELVQGDEVVTKKREHSRPRVRPSKIRDYNDDGAAQKRLNEISAHKSFDSKDMRDEINKAARCKTSGNMLKAVKHLRLGREMLENMIQKLEQKDKMKALAYFKNIF